MALTCQAIFGDERGAELAEFVERATGALCPCRQGKACPLMPDDEALVALPSPRLRDELGQVASVP